MITESTCPHCSTFISHRVEDASVECPNCSRSFSVDRPLPPPIPSAPTDSSSPKPKTSRNKFWMVFLVGLVAVSVWSALVQPLPTYHRLDAALALGGANPKPKGLIPGVKYGAGFKRGYKVLDVSAEGCRIESSADGVDDNDVFVDGLTGYSGRTYAGPLYLRKVGDYTYRTVLGGSRTIPRFATISDDEEEALKKRIADANRTKLNSP